MLELIMLPTLVVGIAIYVTWIEVKNNRPFKWAFIDGLASGIALGIIYYCIRAGSI